MSDATDESGVYRMGNVRINRDTLVPIGLVVTVVVALAGFAFAAYGYFQNQFNMIRDEVRETGARVERLEERAMDRWSQTDQALWVLTLQRDNPNLNVPPPTRGVLPVPHGGGS